MPHHTEPSMKDCRVLIVEDEYLVGDLAIALRPLGIHEIGPIPELSDAMSVEQNDFDVAVIDINLRGCSAYAGGRADACRKAAYFHDWLNRNVKQKTVPRGSFGVAQSRPPCASTIERQMESPMPKPVGFVV